MRIKALILEPLIGAAAALIVVSLIIPAVPGAGTWLERAHSLFATLFTHGFGQSLLLHDYTVPGVAKALARSAAIIGITTLMIVGIAGPLGVAFAKHSHSRFLAMVRYGLNTLSSVPILVWATIVFAVASRKFHLTLRPEEHPIATMFAAVLVLVMGDHLIADIAAHVETNAREILLEPYMRTVRMAGLGERRHLIQSLARPVAEAVLARAMFLVGGAILAEFIFEIPGIGYIVVKTLEEKPPELLLLLACSIALIGLGVAFRVAYRSVVILADPRIRG